MKNQKYLVINLNKASSKTISRAIRIVKAKVGSQDKIAGFVYEIAKYIRREASKIYKSAQYSGKKDYRELNGIVRASDNARPVWGYEYKFQQVEGLYWFERTKVKVDRGIYLDYVVEFKGHLPMMLEFGTGDRYFPSGYSSKMSQGYDVGTGTFTNNPEIHFTGKNGLDTWVYKGEQGDNPYFDGIPLDSKGNPRNGYYYSQGNYPSYGLFKAVKMAKRNVNEIVSTVNWNYWLDK